MTRPWCWPVKEQDQHIAVHGWDWPTVDETQAVDLICSFPQDVVMSSRDSQVGRLATHIADKYPEMADDDRAMLATILFRRMCVAGHYLRQNHILEFFLQQNGEDAHAAFACAVAQVPVTSGQADYSYDAGAMQDLVTRYMALAGLVQELEQGDEG